MSKQIMIGGILVLSLVLIWWLMSSKTSEPMVTNYPSTTESNTSVPTEESAIPESNGEMAEPPSYAYAFTTTDGQRGTFAYTNTSRTNMRLVFADTEYQLTRAVSGSGARYTNNDETVEFWEHQGTATITIDTVSYKVDALPVAPDPMLNNIYFDEADATWKDSYGVCNTCTVENGFSADGTIAVE